MKQGKFVSALSALCLVAAAGSVQADGGVTFTDIALGGGAGINYQRVAPPRLGQVAGIIAQSPIASANFVNVIRPQQFPQKGWGSTGVVIFDYDNDGDLDIYATNGPGGNNALFSSQLMESGQLTFTDVGAAAGVGAFDQDSSGACAGDIDNDGDSDLYVVATGMSNRLFRNNGDGTFTDITAQAGVGGNNRHAVGCSFADFDNDGLLDVVVANTYDNWNHSIPVMATNVPIYNGFEHNYLFMNQGGNTFSDESAARGIENVFGASGPGLTGASFTWAITSVDYDLDGDVDIFFNDTQGSASQGIGYPRPFVNDGTGHFTDMTAQSGLLVPGSWMGQDFGDFNCDGLLDFFSTDLGYLGNGPSRWFLQNPDRTFTQNRAGTLLMTPFGWGTSVFDYDNDGDPDIVYHGGMDMLQFVIYDNPGPILQNQGCSANFVWDSAAITAEHRTRSVQGVAVGDLNRDGFEDIVSLSDSDSLAVGRFLLPGTNLTGGPTGSPFDPVVLLDLIWRSAVNPGFVTYDTATTQVIGPGTLAVEVSSGNNGNGWAEITTRGSFGTLSNGKVNRDGFGAVVYFTPDGGTTAIRPIMGGSSYGSEDAKAANFGMGTATNGMVEVLWPGGVRNRLIDVAPGDRILFPEIPCDVITQQDDPEGYAECVNTALDELVAEGVINTAERARFIKGAFSCQPSDTTLCLQDGRFKVEVAWKNFEGVTGNGVVFSAGNQHGAFYFFNPEVLEFHVNLIDACSLRNRFWVFAAASTNVEYTMTVTDTETQTVKTYFNMLGKSAPAITDTEAFATCP